VRSHAQKYFLKLEKAGNQDAVPPPRPKKRAARPYPTSASRRARGERPGRGSAGRGDASGGDDSEGADWPASGEDTAPGWGAGVATTRAAARARADGERGRRKSGDPASSVKAEGARPRGARPARGRGSCASSRRAARVRAQATAAPASTAAAPARTTRACRPATMCAQAGWRSTWTCRAGPSPCPRWCVRLVWRAPATNQTCRRNGGTLECSWSYNWDRCLWPAPALTREALRAEARCRRPRGAARRARLVARARRAWRGSGGRACVRRRRRDRQALRPGGQPVRGGAGGAPAHAGAAGAHAAVRARPAQAADAAYVHAK